VAQLNRRDARCLRARLPPMVLQLRMPRSNPQQDEKYAHAIRTKPTGDFHDKIGQEQPHALQQRASYSITSSAVASRSGGTLGPSALAVLRLMTN